jgi:hypothetical protein
MSFVRKHPVVSFFAWLMVCLGRIGSLSPLRAYAYRLAHARPISLGCLVQLWRH